MLQQQQTRTNSRGESYVIGPTGAPLTLRDLPPADTGRWVIRRKAEVVAAVRGGLLSLEDALERYRLTSEEFLAWQRSIDRHGLAGLAPPAFSSTAEPPLIPGRFCERAAAALSPERGRFHFRPSTTSRP